jgi:hypothetical protein
MTCNPSLFTCSIPALAPFIPIDVRTLTCNILIEFLLSMFRAQFVLFLLIDGKFLERGIFMIQISKRDISQTVSQFFKLFKVCC